MLTQVVINQSIAREWSAFEYVETKLLAQGEFVAGNDPPPPVLRLSPGLTWLSDRQHVYLDWHICADWKIVMVGIVQGQTGWLQFRIKEHGVQVTWASWYHFDHWLRRQRQVYMVPPCRPGVDYLFHHASSGCSSRKVEDKSEGPNLVFFFLHTITFPIEYLSNWFRFTWTSL